MNTTYLTIVGWVKALLPPTNTIRSSQLLKVIVDVGFRSSTQPTIQFFSLSK
ncbi:hypothetical protein [Dulcicalothrix desertica]|uniref:hypothetical protein n=1 Tax=Dulcicalothrix desertica TaxID=32056 RepID=UPI0013156426|nr:hypothetical protein [Dulcicalothrix desertica]